MKKFLISLCCCIGLSYQYGYSQTSCAQTLRLAQSIYEQGRLHELENTLAECLKGNNFTTQEKVAAYKLLTLAYIYLEEPEKADNAMLTILRADNEFSVNESADPAEFVALYKTFRTNPIYRLGGKVGTTVSQPNVISSEYAADGSGGYGYRFGFQGQFSAEIPLSKKLVLNPELALQIKSFKNSLSVRPNDSTNFTTDALETGTWVSFPVSLQYELYQKKNTYYISGGFSFEYLLSNSLNIRRLRGDFSPVDEGDFDIRDQRNQFDYSALISAGFKRKIGPGLVVAEVRYIIGLNPVQDKSAMFQNQTLVNSYHYVDGIFSLRTLTVSIGYMINIYKPKKLTTLNK
jgi:hypothetical protein